MATVTIKKPFKIIAKGEAWFDALPSSSRCTIKAKESQISGFEYVVNGNTYTLPTGGAATSAAGTDAADLDDLDSILEDDPPDTPFTVSFNTGTLARKPPTGSPYKVEVTGVDADMLVTGAASAVTYGSGGELRLDAAGSGHPTRKSES